MHYSVSFPGGVVQYLLNTPFSKVKELVDPGNCVILTDNNIADIYKELFVEFKGIIVVEANEKNKTIDTVITITQQLLDLEVHRNIFLLGVGGGMITDITGFVASIYMRGIRFGFVPTSLLGMVDASVGGKNGVNFNLQKNQLGTISQPQFILFDNHFLSTLSEGDWSNGFAEIIKYACLFDKALFEELATNNIGHYKNDQAALTALVSKCVDWKNKIVLADERENGRRKLLNFGHTTGHAFETILNIPHGHAVALGMLVACILSETEEIKQHLQKELRNILKDYDLPINTSCNIEQLMEVITMDKKRNYRGIDFVLLQEIGRPEIVNIQPDDIRTALDQFLNEQNS